MEDVLQYMPRLAVMLGAGLLARHALLRVGRAWAAGNSVRIPALCSYATAGTLAALLRAGLSRMGLEGLLLALLFGLAWGCVAGLMLPFSRRAERVPATR